MTSVNLSKYDNSWFYIGAGKMKAIIWYFVNVFFYKLQLESFFKP